MYKTPFFKKNICSLLVGSGLLLASCGNSDKTTGENNPDSTTTATDTAGVAIDTSTQTSAGTASLHPVSDWGQKPHPYFASAKVDELVNAKAVYEPTEDEVMDYTHDHLNKTEMSKLNTKELIYYCLKYPCSFSQICAADDFIDSTHTPKISGHLPFDYSGAMMSEWQQQAVEKKRDSVIIVLNSYISENPEELENEYLALLLDLKAVESIPVVSKIAQDNNYGYTYLVALMMENKYAPFEKTGMYRQLYGDNSWSYGMRIEASKANLDSIKTLAKDFYKTQRTK